MDNYINRQEHRSYSILWYHHDDGSKLGGILTLFVILIRK